MSFYLRVSERGISSMNERYGLSIAIVYQALNVLVKPLEYFLKDSRRTKNTLKKSPDKWRKATIWPSVNGILANC